MKIKYLRAKNFLSIGNEPIEIDFTKYDNIINIRGENHDMGDGASNGAGKTTILQSILYGLYGRLLKGLTHKEIINIKSKKGLEVEIHVDDYKIIRKRSPDGLELWLDGKSKPESLGGMPATQQYILDNILKLSYQAFVNVVCFGQHIEHSFLTADPKDKRAIAENLLSLEKYGKYCETAKKQLKILNDKVEKLSLIYEKDLNAVDGCKNQLEHVNSQRQLWINRQQNNIKIIEEKITKTKYDLDNCDEADAVKQYQEAQIQLSTTVQHIDELESKLEKLIEIKDKCQKVLESVRNERNEVILSERDGQRKIEQLRADIKAKRQEIESLGSKRGSRCSLCYGVVGEDNCEHILKNNTDKINSLEENLIIEEKRHQNNLTKLENYEQQSEKLNNNLRDVTEKENLFNSRLREFRNKNNELNKVRMPQGSSRILQEQMRHLEESLLTARNELDPYISITDKLKLELGMMQKSVSMRREEIEELSREVPYYEYWVKGFGDQGIRSFILKEIMPILNSRINYWLQFLVDNKIQISFNSELEVTIERCPADGDCFVYNAMSGGEHSRINLAISQAFADVTTMTAGCDSSGIVSMDEVGVNLDRPGIQAIYRTLCELAREKQVLVTSHDPDLLELLSTHQTITVVKKDGISKIK